MATSQPRAAQGAPFSSLRTTARTLCPASINERATAPPTWPVIPVTAYIFWIPYLIRETLARCTGIGSSSQSQAFSLIGQEGEPHRDREIVTRSIDGFGDAATHAL